MSKNSIIVFAVSAILAGAYLYYLYRYKKEQTSEGTDKGGTETQANNENEIETISEENGVLSYEDIVNIEGVVNFNV